MINLSTQNSTKYRPKTEFDVICDKAGVGYVDFLIYNIEKLAKANIDGAQTLAEKLKKASNTPYRMVKGIMDVNNFESELTKSYWFQFELYGYTTIYNCITDNDLSIPDNKSLELLMELYIEDYEHFIEKMDSLMKNKDILRLKMKKNFNTIKNETTQEDIVDIEQLNKIFGMGD